jgi:hypothetical protein
MVVMSTSPNMSFTFVRGILIGVFGPRDPSPDEWAAHCTRINQVRHQARGIILYTEGGGPNAKQRDELARAWAEVPRPPLAIITTSAVVRGILAMTAWWRGAQQITAFTPAELEAATSFLRNGGADATAQLIVDTFRANASKVGVTLPSGISAAGLSSMSLEASRDAFVRWRRESTPPELGRTSGDDEEAAE